MNLARLLFQRSDRTDKIKIKKNLIIAKVNEIETAKNIWKKYMHEYKVKEPLHVCRIGWPYFRLVLEKR